MKSEKMSDKKKQTRTSLRSSNGASCSSTEISPNILSRPKRVVSKRSLDASDFLTSHEEERQIAKALKESLKELKKNGELISPKSQITSKTSITEPPKDVPTSSKPPKDPPPPPLTARPRRDAAQRASTKEERELRKAIELSKRSIVEEKRKREESSSIVSPSSPVTDLSAAASTSSASNLNPTARRKEDDTKSQVSDISSMDEMMLKKPKIPPQRKFAQNSIPPHCTHPNSCTPVKHSSAQSFVHNPHSKSVHQKEVFNAITPSTEDFLTFLCFRNTPALPQKVDLFAMNEKAIQEKQLQSPKNTASVASQSKHDGTKLSNGGVANNKNVDSRRSSATSSTYSSNPFQRTNPPPRKSNIKLAIKSESHMVNGKPVKRMKKVAIPEKQVKKKKCSSATEQKSVKKGNAEVEITPIKRITRSTSSTSYAESSSSTVPPVIMPKSVQEELKAQQEKRLKEQMIAIEKQHQVRRRFSSDSSLHSSDSSSSESLPSTSSSASINISRVTRSIETLKQLRVIGQQSKLKGSHNGQTRRFARGQVASKAILQKAKRNLNSKSCSNGKLNKLRQ